MTAADYARGISVVVWAAVFLLRFGSLWRVLRGRSTEDDVLWAMWAAFGLMVIGFNLRWYIAAESVLAYVGLHVFSACLASWSLYVTRTYRRYRRG